MIATLTLPPLSASELCQAVRLARPFNANRLDRVLRLDASRGHVEVQASATWSRLAAYLRPSAPQAIAPWSDTASIGDDVATNAPGPDGRPAVGYVESITLVTPEGELRRVSRAHGELFSLVVGGQGLFGTLYSVTLSLESLARAASDAAPPAVLSLPAGEAATRTLHALVPPHATEPFLAEVRARCAEWRVAIEGIEVRRTLAEEETVLRWARREYAAMRLTLAEPRALGGAVRTTQLHRELIDCAIAHGGSFPISCTPMATRAQVEACYPQLADFLADKRRLDPAERLTNGWYRHHRNLLGRQSCAVRWTRQAA
ncbi:MAG TPA: FAD-binding protein [Burkholderiales bacterium]|nr:FAD-binding protein [Burkholderiales bacterium]